MRKQLEVAEKELNKREKVIAKSKKLKDVQALMDQHEHALEEVRLQNQGLINNLNEIVLSNEKLQAEYDEYRRRCLPLPSQDAAPSEQTQQELQTLQQVHQDLQAEMATLQGSLAELRIENADLRGKLAKSMSQQQLPTSDEEAAQADGGSSAAGAVEDTVAELQKMITDAETRAATATQAQRAAELAAKAANDALADARTAAQAREAELQAEVAAQQDKVKKKQASYLALQEEKERVFAQHQV